jgi:2'-hydroxyisoflavone reductase
MHILIIGGTVFLGRHIVEAALARGHTITMFNRGKRNPELFPEVEKLRGDRDNPAELAVLNERRFDAVIDTCGYLPRAVRASAEMLAPRTNHYTFISSISVYADYSKVGITEDDPVGTLADPTVEEVTGESYGPLKALCEQAAEAALPGRTLNIRPGLIVGPHDPTDRFTYWPVRVARGGPLLAPERPGYLVQVIDVRDLAVWTLHMIEHGQVGIYNATGPDYALTIGDVIETCVAVSGSDAQARWASAALLAEQGIAPWSELPLWVPEGPDTAGFATVDCSKAIADGLSFRPIAETVRDTLAWAQSRPADYQWRAGLSAEKEQAALLKLDEEQQSN